MEGEITPSQRAYIRRKAKPKELSPQDEAGELNIVPFLDIIMNILMFVLATITTVFTATIEIPAPRSGPSSGGAEDDRIMITVKVVDQGYIVAGPGGFLQPGCTAVATAALTVPLINGRHDGEGLTRCMQAIRNNQAWAPRMLDETTGRPRRDIQVAINGNVPYHILVETLDALRESAPGRNDLFDQPILGIL